LSNTAERAGNLAAQPPLSISTINADKAWSRIGHKLMELMRLIDVHIGPQLAILRTTTRNLRTRTVKPESRLFKKSGSLTASRYLAY
jgi:hypothetical protein